METIRINGELKVLGRNQAVRLMLEKAKLRIKHDSSQQESQKTGANGQGKTREDCLANLREAIALILEHRREESLRALPPDAAQEPVIVG